jgi:uncharacterized peroxidase-related enzyme
MSRQKTVMPRIAPIEPQNATGGVKRSFDAVKANLGFVPNGVRVLAASQHALRGYLGLSAGLEAGALSRAEREQIAILTAERNECEYCLAAHTHAGRAAGLSEPELRASRVGAAGDARGAALLRLAGAVIDHRGDVPDEELAAARRAGLTDAELIEVVAEVSVNTFSNYANRLARPGLDFPPVPRDARAASSDRAA